MDDEAIAARIVRLRRALAASIVRHARRHNRSSMIWHGYKNYYKHSPGLRAHFTIYESWDNRRRSWSYEEALCFEIEGGILANRLMVLLQEAVEQRPPPQRKGLLRLPPQGEHSH